MRLHRFVVVWTFLVLVGWVVTAAILIGQEPDCSTSSFICFEPGEIWLITGVFVAGIWLAGLFVVAIVAGLVWWHRKLSQEP
jgi:hypothetical protein